MSLFTWNTSIWSLLDAHNLSIMDAGNFMMCNNEERIYDVLLDHGSYSELIGGGTGGGQGFNPFSWFWSMRDCD